MVPLRGKGLTRAAARVAGLVLGLAARVLGLPARVLGLPARVLGLAVLVLGLPALALGLPATALADYSGSISGQVATLTGSGPVVITTSGGLLQHNNLGSGFASATDFDSTQAGTQQIPDTGGWEVDLTGAGSDTLEVDEGEPTDPVTYTNGHDTYPGGKPCLVRDPNDDSGAVRFSNHPTQETRLCYLGGFSSVSVHAGPGSIEYDVLDTQAGVPLHFYGGAGGNDQFTEAADVQSETPTDHNAASPVYFTPGKGAASVTYIDASGTAPATYTIGNGEILKQGYQPIYFTGTSAADLIELYPEPGPSTIDIGPTGGAPTQIFGNFFGQPGPDVIDGSHADAPLYITGSLGSDTITGGPFADFIDGGGGNDAINVVGGGSDQVNCSAGSTGLVQADQTDLLMGCTNVQITQVTGVTGATGPIATGNPPGGPGPGTGATPKLSHVRFSPKTVTIKRHTTLKLKLTSSAAGTLSVSFLRPSCKHAKRCTHYRSVGSIGAAKVKAGSQSLKLADTIKVGKHKRTLAAGTYTVMITLSAAGARSNPAITTIVIRAKH